MCDRNIEDILNEVRSPYFSRDPSLFPPVLSHTFGEDNFCLTLDIRPDLGWFRGHFPGRPVLPGVVQLSWAVVVAQAVFGITGSPQEILRLKFKSVVVPPCAIVLTLTRPVPADVRFVYAGNGQQYSQGEIRFAGIAQ